MGRVGVLLLILVVGTVLGEEGWLFVEERGGEVEVFASKEILSHPDVRALNVRFEPSRMKYYLLENHQNSPLTSAWVGNILRNSRELFRTSLSLLVCVEVENEEKFLASLPYDVDITSVSPKPYRPNNLNLSLLTNLATTLAPSDAIQELVDQVNDIDLRFFVEYLSGELEGSSLLTRNSISKDAIYASEWIKTQFEESGFKSSLQCYRADYSCNVVGILQGSTFPNEVIVLGAHYDSRGPTLSSPTQRAPGANDDGSGTGTLLMIAKAIGQSQTKFARTIHIVAFSGEEQGLLGSQAYAASLVQSKINVVAMLQNDMIAYRAPGTGLLCGFPFRYTTPELTELAIAATNLYSPNVTTGRNDRCCSDHQSFYQSGFPTTDFSDTIGPIVDPQYHQSGDLVNRLGFDFEKYVGIVKGYFATAAVVAQPIENI